MQLEKMKPLGVLVAEAREQLVTSIAELGGASGIEPEVLLVGDPETMVTGLAGMEQAGPGDLTFATAPAYLKKVLCTGAAAVIVPPDLASELHLPALVTPVPRLIFAILLGLCGRTPEPVSGQPFFVDQASVTLGSGVIIGPNAYIGRDVRVGAGTVIGAHVFLEDGVTIGTRCIIHPGAIIRWGVQIGHRCQIHSGAVIGDDGFGYTQLPQVEDGRLIHYKNVHMGGVVLGDDVEIGANTTIDRGLVSNTVVGQGSKIDNLVQVGHNVQVGRDCIVVSQVGIGGHSVLGDRVFLLGQAGVGPGVTIGDDVVLGGQAGLPRGTVPPGKRLWLGCPARLSEETYQTQALSASQLPRLRSFFQLFKKSTSFDELKSAFLAVDQEKRNK